MVGVLAINAQRILDVNRLSPWLRRDEAFLVETSTGTTIKVDAMGANLCGREVCIQAGGQSFGVRLARVYRGSRGFRWWGVCPCCGRLAVHFYAAGDGLPACARCLGIVSVCSTISVSSRKAFLLETGVAREELRLLNKESRLERRRVAYRVRRVLRMNCPRECPTKVSRDPISSPVVGKLDLVEPPGEHEIQHG